jgi:ferredoxin
MRITTDADKCLGTGNCALIAPDVFDQDDEEGAVTLLQTVPPAEQYEAGPQSGPAVSVGSHPARGGLRMRACHGYHVCWTPTSTRSVESQATPQ